MKLSLAHGLLGSASAPQSWQPFASSFTVPTLDAFPHFNTRTLVGIAVAISGNVLISLALNLQKLAHKRVEREKVRETSDATTEDTIHEDDEYAGPTDSARNEDVFIDSSNATPNAELEPLTATSTIRNYGSSGTTLTSDTPKSKSSIASHLLPLHGRTGSSRKLLIPVDIMSEDAALHGLPTKSNGHKPNTDDSDFVEEAEGAYLKSKLWWTGFLLMNVGELGNFISYAFAPASVVAPLGTFALVANCFLAPLLLKEHFRTRDLFGVAVAIIGAVTVVLASNSSDTRLDSDGLLRAIAQTSFLIYSCIYIAGALILATLSQGQVGKDWVFVDVGLCALFGGFTVLSTKAFSTLLAFERLTVFTKWITYPLIAVLALTGVGQIRYLNRALMRFDSKVVIPVQFVLFTLSAIIGSAILYGDFQRAQFHQIVTFLYGCAATFAGVFIIAWSPSDAGGGQAEPPAIQEPGNEEAELGADNAHLGLGTLGNRQRATLVLPSGVPTPRPTPELRHKRSAVGMLAISPAQRLLLVHTPPREVVAARGREAADVERLSPSPTVTRRRRTMSWYGQQPPRPERVDNVIRGNSISGRLRQDFRVGSYEDRSTAPRPPQEPL